MKRLAPFMLAVMMMALGSNQIAYAAGTSCSVGVPGRQLTGGGRPWGCFSRFYVPTDGRYAIRLAPLSASGGLPGGGVPATGAFGASVSGSTLDIQARFVAGVLVDGASSATGNLTTGWRTLIVYYSDQRVLNSTCLLDHDCVGPVYPGFGGAIGSVGNT